MIDKGVEIIKEYMNVSFTYNVFCNVIIILNLVAKRHLDVNVADEVIIFDYYFYNVFVKDIIKRSYISDATIKAITLHNNLKVE